MGFLTLVVLPQVKHNEFLGMSVIKGKKIIVQNFKSKEITTTENTHNSAVVK